MMKKVTMLVTRKDDSHVEETVELEEHKMLTIEDLIVKRFNNRIDVVEYEILKIEDIQ